jgi:CheY-like chemotaxis protein
MLPATVLLIDRDQDSVEIYRLILEHHGYRVLHAPDGVAGVRIAVEEHPDVVISELFLPRIDGASVLDLLRRDVRTAAMPLILLDSIPTFAVDFEPDLADARRLTKPCEPSRLLREVQRLLKNELRVLT